MEEGKMGNVATVRAVLAILQWWGFNVTVIIINKWIFQKLEFKFPLTVSCVHFICSSIGAYIAIKVLKVKPLIEVAPEDRWKRIFPMSFVFCINIVLGNISLRYISVSFMQTIKSFTPATTVILQWLVWRIYFEWRLWASLIPIVGGILLTSVTELSFNMLGFCAAMVGCLATSTKTILAESLLHGYKFDSINSVLHGTLCHHDTIDTSDRTRRERRNQLALHIRFNRPCTDHHNHLRSSRLLPQLLHLLRHPLNDGGDLQCSRQSQGGCRGTDLLDDLPEPDLRHERRRVWDHARRLHLLRLCEASDLPAGCRPEPAHPEKPVGDAPPRRRKAREDLAAGHVGALDNHRNNEHTAFGFRKSKVS